MARDYTKYSVDNETFVGKGKLARRLLEQWINRNGHRTLAQLQEIFKDEVQGSTFLRSKEDVESNYDRKRFDPTEVPCEDKVVLVSNQWGTHNIDALLQLAEQINIPVYDNREKESTESSTDDSKEKNYTEFFEEQPFDDTIKHFIEETKAELKKYSWESEEDCDLVYDLFEELKEITETDVPRYGGYLYLFSMISEEIGEGEFMTMFDWDFLEDLEFTWHDMIGDGKNAITKTAEIHGLENFKRYFPSIFVLNLLQSIDYADSEEVCDYILSSNNDAALEVFSAEEIEEMGNDFGDWIADAIIEILKAIGYDLDEYEGAITFNGVHFLKQGMDLGYDYLKLSEDLRDSLA